MGICGVFMGLLLHFDHVHGQQVGRDAFLAKEAARYDRHFAHAEPLIVDIIASLILFFVFFAISESMAFAIFKILEKVNPPAGN